MLMLILNSVQHDGVLSGALLTDNVCFFRQIGVSTVHIIFHKLYKSAELTGH